MNLTYKLLNMSLLQWIEQSLETIAPDISNLATIVASVASVMASISWLVSQALGFIANHNNI
jgi:hypothetical protein